MAITEKPKQYLSHGKPFDTAKAAELHDKLYAAREELEAAQRRFQHVLAENAVTADGHPFQFGVFRDYYHIVRPAYAKPHLRQFCYLCWSWSVREQIDRPEVIEIREETDKGDSRYIPIRELYASLEIAKDSLIAAQREWVEEQRKWIEEDAAKMLNEAR